VLGLRAGSAGLFILPQTNAEKETLTMSLFHWLRNLRSARRARGTSRQRLAPRFRPRLEFLEDRQVPSTLTVLNTADSGPRSLRDTIAAADSRDTIVFDPSLAGQTITLTGGELAINKSLDIEGPGQGQLPVTVSGNGTSRVFDIAGPSTTATLANLNIANGIAGQGGGIFDSGATLYLVHDTVAGTAQGAPGVDAQGGAIYQAGGQLSLTQCSLSGTANGGAGDAATPGGAALGGGIYNAGGVLTANDCVFKDFALGGNGAPGGAAVGGDIYDTAATTATITASQFSGQAQGGVGLAIGEAGAGVGGGIYQGGGSLSLTSCQSSGFNQVASGFAIGERGVAAPAQGGFLYVAGGTVSMVNTTVFAAAFGTPAEGGGMYLAAGSVAMSNCTVSSRAVGTNSDALGGGIYMAGGNLAVQSSTISSTALAENNTNQGNGGGIYEAGGVLTSSNCLFTNCYAANYGYVSYGGGLYVAAGTASIDKCAFEDDNARGNLGGEGFGGAIYIAPDGSVCISQNTSFLDNRATTSGDNIVGTYTIC
jgi:hypothetical protein